MERLAKLLKNYVAQHPPVCGDAQAVVDQLYWAFMENHRSDNDKTKEYLPSCRNRLSCQCGNTMKCSTRYRACPWNMAGLPLWRV